MTLKYKILATFCLLLLILLFISGYYSAINPQNWITGNCEKFLYSDLNRNEDPWKDNRDLECNFFKCDSGNLAFEKGELNGIAKIKVLGFYAFLFGKVGSCQSSVGDMRRRPVLFNLEDKVDEHIFSKE